MSGARRIVAARCAAVPWRNGGGVTRELDAASGGAPDWRLSLADIDRDGPFSVLAGVDRVFAPVEGALALVFAHEAPRALDATSAPFAFDGALAPHARLAGGRPARALNLMCARGRRTGSMRRVVLADGGTPDAVDLGASTRAGADVLAWYVQDGCVTVGGAAYRAGTLLLLHEPSDGAAATPAGAAAPHALAPPPRAIGPARLVEVRVSAPLRSPIIRADGGTPPAPRSAP